MVGVNRQAWRPLLMWIAIPLMMLLLGLAVVVAVGLWRWDTARQSEVTDAVPAMRRAVADAVVAAGPGAGSSGIAAITATFAALGARPGSGGRREFHPPAPTDPGVTVSCHRASV